MNLEELMLDMKTFIEAVKVAIWAAQADELGREVAYMDDEIIVFRKKKDNAHV